MNKSWWEGEPDALLRRCIAAGMTYTEAGKAISEKCGRAITRNAAIGRAHRLGIECRSTLEHRNEQARIGQGRAARSPTKLGNHRMRIRGVEGPGSPAWAPEVGPEAVGIECTEVQHGVSLYEVTGCRWPLGGYPNDTPVTFCNNPQAGGSSYCRGHLHLSIRPRIIPERGDAVATARRRNLHPTVTNLAREYGTEEPTC